MTSSRIAWRPSARVLITLLAALSIILAQMVAFGVQPVSASGGSNTFDGMATNNTGSNDAGVTCDKVGFDDNKVDMDSANQGSISGSWGMVTANGKTGSCDSSVGG